MWKPMRSMNPPALSLIFRRLARRADAATSRASCQVCKQTIEEGSLKLVEFKKSPFHDGFDQKNAHAGCRACPAGPLDARKMLLLRVDDQLAYSRDEDPLSPWTLAPTPAYGYAVEMAGGGAGAAEAGLFNATHRERPKLLFDKNGQPDILFNGVATEAYGHTFTLAQKIRAFRPP